MSPGRSGSRFPEGPGSSPGFLLWRVTLAWQRAVTAALGAYGLTHVQFVLLACAWWLTEQGDVPNQQRLARQAGTDIKMTSQVVRALETRGLLRREPDPADSRARLLTPTAEGRRLARRAVAAVEAADAEFFGHQAGALTRTLRHLIGSAESDGRPRDPNRGPTLGADP